MDRFQLATLLSWAGDAGIQGRKRLQKVVFFLQAVGCPLNCRFTLHHYGPYSRDVADVCDEMVAVGLLNEQVVGNMAGVQYSYKLTPETKNLLALTGDRDPARVQALHPFRDHGTRLLGEDVWTLELGSTILFFFQQSRDWTIAQQQACNFKGVGQDNRTIQIALRLAQEFSSVPTPHSSEA